MMRWLRRIDWFVVVGVITSLFVALVIFGMIVAAFREDSAGRPYTEIPYREYRVDGHPVWAFELYGLKCVAVSEGLSCVDTDA